MAGELMKEELIAKVRDCHSCEIQMALSIKLIVTMELFFKTRSVQILHLAALRTEIISILQKAAR